MNEEQIEIDTKEPESEEAPINKDIQEVLVPKPQTTGRRTGAFGKFCASIFPCLKKVDTTSKRIIYFNDINGQNITNWSNKEENNKYNVLKVGFLFTYIAPLAFVVAVSMTKELYDDINRRIQDKKTNSSTITVLIPSADRKSVEKIQKKASELLVGDIIELSKDGRVPADIIVLKTFNEANDNQAFIRTDQLDGETDWKLRKAPGLTQGMSEIQLFTSDTFVECEPPSKLIYNFQGVIQSKSPEYNKKEPLNLENTMWASTVVASQGVIGIVAYTGKETRAKMNLSSAKIKIGILDSEVNRSNMYLFAITFIVALIITSAKEYSSQYFFNLIKYIILFSAIIPISLRVNLDVSKIYFSIIINREKEIPETIARNSTIPEELGRISYVFSDKTGTLTKNEMIFKIIAMETELFAEDKFDDLKNIEFIDIEVN